MEGDCNCAVAFHMLKFSNLKMFGGTVYRAEEGKERPMSTDVSVFDRQKAAAFGLVLKVLQSVFGAEPSVGQVNALREDTFQGSSCPSWVGRQRGYCLRYGPVF